MKVYVDNRETEKRKERAKKIFKNIEIKKLNCGDYVCGNTAIEFKKDDDFISSVKDKRIFRQVIEMNQKYHNTYVIVYGNMGKAIQKTRYYGHSFSVNQYLGALSSLVQITNVLVVENENQAFKLAKKLFEKSNDNKNRNVIIPKKVKDKNKMISILMLIGDINSTRAEQIINGLKIKNLNQLINLTEDDIKSLNGFGDKTAKKIVKWLK